MDQRVEALAAALGLDEAEAEFVAALEDREIDGDEIVVDDQGERETPTVHADVARRLGLKTRHPGKGND